MSAVDSYDRETYEHSTLAASEGFADFVAGATFTNTFWADIGVGGLTHGQYVPHGYHDWTNGQSGGQSSYGWSLQGYEQGGLTTQPPIGAEMHLNRAPNQQDLPPGIFAEDALLQRCDPLTMGQNRTKLQNRSTVLDWSRFWWDAVYTETLPGEDLTARDALEIMIDAESWTWCTDITGCASADEPADRIGALFQTPQYTAGVILVTYFGTNGVGH